MAEAGPNAATGDAEPSHEDEDSAGSVTRRGIPTTVIAAVAGLKEDAREFARFVQSHVDELRRYVRYDRTYRPPVDPSTPSGCERRELRARAKKEEN